jgi:hypothetical protein
MASLKNIIQFRNFYTKIITSVPKKYIPMPRYPINTDKLIQEYEKELRYYVVNDKLPNPDKFVMKKTPKIFPKEYFNYESS